jgi:pimeloyl-ACP methyl ester carboxylesterase
MIRNIFILGVGVSCEYMREFKKTHVRSTYIYYDPSKSFEWYEEQILEYEGFVNLIGFSLGGIISLKFKTKHEHKVKRLIIIGFPSLFSSIYKTKLMYHLYPDTWSTPLRAEKKIYPIYLRILSCIDYFPKIVQTPVKRFIYSLMNPDSPETIVKCVAEYKMISFLSSIREYFVDTNINKLLNRSKTNIHLIIGESDEFNHVSEVFFSTTQPYIILHRCREEGHHILYTNPVLVSNKIQSICNTF